MKKLFALLAAIAMLVALALPVTAAEGDYVITITNENPLSSAGHTYEAYQIFDGTLDEGTGTILSNIVWGEAFADQTAIDGFLAELKSAEIFGGAGAANIFSSCTDADDVAGVIAQASFQTTDNIDAFAQIAEKYATVVTATSTEADAPYTILIPAEKAGYYLVKDKDGSLETDPAGNPVVDKDYTKFMLQVVGNVSVNHKGSIPTVTKQVSDDGNAYSDYITSVLNDTHYYRIRADLPTDYALYDYYYLEFVDIMSSGITYLQIEEVYALLHSGGSYTKVIIDPACYTVTPPASDDGGTLSVVFTDTKTAYANGDADQAPIPLDADDEIVVVYTAKLNNNAIIGGTGNLNEVYLKYTNDPNTNGEGKSTPDDTRVYALNLNVVKVDGANQTVALEGAQFVLYRVVVVENDGTQPAAIETKNEYAIIDAATQELTGWADHYAGDGCDSHAADVALGTLLITGEDGTIAVKGLAASIYYLKEVTPPDGYNSLTEDIEVSINATVDDATKQIGNLNGTTNIGTLIFSAENASVSLTVPNNQGSLLPSTGGMGTTLFYVAGAVMVLAAVILLVTRKRMAAQD